MKKRLIITFAAIAFVVTTALTVTFGTGADSETEKTEFRPITKEVISAADLEEEDSETKLMTSSESTPLIELLGTGENSERLIFSI